jgi:hypothetical protein
MSPVRSTVAESGNAVGPRQLVLDSLTPCREGCTLYTYCCPRFVSLTRTAVFPPALGGSFYAIYEVADLGEESSSCERASGACALLLVFRFVPKIPEKGSQTNAHSRLDTLWLLTLESTPLIAIEVSVRLQCYQLLLLFGWLCVLPSAQGSFPEESPCERCLNKPAR